MLSEWGWQCVSSPFLFLELSHCKTIRNVVETISECGRKCKCKKNKQEETIFFSIITVKRRLEMKHFSK